MFYCTNPQQAVGHPALVVSAEGVCELCGRHELVEYGIVKSHSLVQCPACGFVRATTVIESQLAGFYEQEYFEGKLAYGYGRVGATETDQIAKPLAVEKAWLIARYLDPLDPRAILEVGPGLDGGWIKHFVHDPTRRLQCVEISALASEHLNAAGIPTFNGRVEDFRSERPFELAITIEVIEHVMDPVSFVTTIGNLLVPGGHLFLSTGNLRSVTAKRSGLGWYYLDPPAHLSYFDDRNIVQLLRRGGFDEVSVHRFGFKWVELALRYRLTAALPLLHALNCPFSIMSW
ncbi:MAG: class I SAM-dependent methyltransferase [bacterium]|nr:class I SAM-dependent methyltransferase [bacterium]